MSTNGKSQALVPAAEATPAGEPANAITEPATKRTLAKPPKKTKRKPRRSPKTQKEQEMEDRRMKVWAFRKRGYSYEKISRELNVSWMTVKRDLDYIQEQIRDTVVDFDVQGFVAEDMAEYDDLITHGWSQYEEGVNVHQRVKALDFIRSVKGDRFKALKDSGLIEGKPVEVEHKVTAAVIHGWSDKIRKAASEAILESMMSSTPLEPTAEMPENIIEVPVAEVSAPEGDAE